MNTDPTPTGRVYEPVGVLYRCPDCTGEESVLIVDPDAHDANQTQPPLKPGALQIS